MPIDVPKGKDDRPIPSGIPRGFRGETQRDGTETTHFTPPVKKAPMASREAVPDRASDSGMERAMHGLADKQHPRR